MSIANVIKRTVGALLAVLLVTSLVPRGDLASPTAVLEAQGNCAACVPPERSDIYHFSGTVSVCVLSDGSHDLAAHSTDLEAGFAYWQTALNDAGNQLSFNVSYSSSSCSGADITVKYDSSVPSGDAALSSPSTGIGMGSAVFDSSLASNHNFWQGLGAHEMGHVLGFTDVHSGPNLESCSSSTTIMYYQVDPSSFTMPSSPSCADRAAATRSYTGSNGPSDDDYWEEHGEECWDQYLVRTYYYVVNNVVYEGGTVMFFIQHYCGPPPI